jgi:hypothetical protein
MKITLSPKAENTNNFNIWSKYNYVLESSVKNRQDIHKGYSNSRFRCPYSNVWTTKEKNIPMDHDGIKDESIICY